MNSEVIITCAVTGAGDTANKHPDLPITPTAIAAACVEAADAGAAVVVHAVGLQQRRRVLPHNHPVVEGVADVVVRERACEGARVNGTGDCGPVALSCRRR